MSTRSSKPGAHGAPHPSAFDLDSAVRALRAEQGSAAQALALEQRLAAALGPAALAGAGGAGAAGAAGGAWGGGWLLVVLGLGTIGALGLHAYQQAQPHAASMLHAEPAAAPRSAAVPVQLPVQLQEPVAPSVEPVVIVRRAQPARAHEPRRKPRHARVVEPVAVESSAAPTADVASELALLQRSRAALRRDPAAALALAEQHARAYPHGMFAQEREVLAIEALLRSRSRAAALQRAHTFVTGHPDSPYAVRIRALLDEVPASHGSATAVPADGDGVIAPLGGDASSSAAEPAQR